MKGLDLFSLDVRDEIRESSIFKERDMMGMEFGGLFGLLVLAADVWAIVNIFQSPATTGMKVAWIVGVLIFPLIGFLVWLAAGPRERSGS